MPPSDSNTHSNTSTAPVIPTISFTPKDPPPITSVSPQSPKQSGLGKVFIYLFPIILVLGFIGIAFRQHIASYLDPKEREKRTRINEFVEEFNTPNQNVYLSEKDKEAKPLSSYPKEAEKVFDTFIKGSYKIGVEHIKTTNNGINLSSHTIPDAWGDYFYYKNGILLRYDKDVAKSDYSAPIEPQLSTLYVIYKDNQVYHLRPKTTSGKRYTIFPEDKKQKEKFAEHLSALFDIFVRLEEKESLFVTSKQNYYWFNSIGKPSYIFYVNPSTNTIDHIFLEGENNSSETYTFNYESIRNVEDLLEIPQDYEE